MSPVVTAVRLGRLGDLVMTLPALQWLSDRVALQVLTSTVYVPWLAWAVPGARVVSRPEALDLADAVLDLHRVPASRRVMRQVPRVIGALRAHTDKESLRRRLLLTPLPGPLPRRTWPERHLRAVAGLARELGLPAPPTTSLPRLPSDGTLQSQVLGLVPGAAWATKRWPTAHFGELASRWHTRTGGTSVVFASTQEDDLADAVIAASDGTATRWPEGGPAGADPLVALSAGIGSCAAIVAGDTGPLHLAGALRRPLVGLFGPTPRAAGFAVWAEDAAYLGGADCSPCSMHGMDRCPRADLRCLADLLPSVVLAEVLAVTGRRDAA